MKWNPCCYLDACGKEEFRCEAGDCIHVSQVCDFIVDCTDGSDEFCGESIFWLLQVNLFQYFYFKCKIYHIHMHLHCILYIINTIFLLILEMDFCHYDEFICDSGQCIPFINRCDAYVHCFDGSDEDNCGIFFHLIWHFPLCICYMKTTGYYIICYEDFCLFVTRFHHTHSAHLS